MNKLILNIDNQEFIEKNLMSGIHKLTLKGSAFEGVDIKELIEQIEAKKRHGFKLPTSTILTNSILSKPHQKLLHLLKVV